MILVVLNGGLDYAFLRMVILGKDFSSNDNFLQGFWFWVWIRFDFSISNGF
jgi:hypothetical protein